MAARGQSSYPDGSRRDDNFELVIPERRADANIKVEREDVYNIVCHRKTEDRHEQYLVEWNLNVNPRLYSWHYLDELANCLRPVQVYLDNFHKEYRDLRANRKRKSPDSDDVSSSSDSLQQSSPAPSLRSSSSVTTRSDHDVRSYNGTLYVVDGRYKIRQVTFSTGSCIVTHEHLPSEAMLRHAQHTKTFEGHNKIRCAFLANLLVLSEDGPRIYLYNKVDDSTPSLDFEFITKSVRGRGVEKTPKATIVGCGTDGTSGGCRPNMGQNIGCEYGRKCDCLEFAAVDESRLTEEEKAKLDRGDLAGLPKRFPYSLPRSKKAFCLVPFYLDSRHPIYECNVRCNCGPDCKTRVVQKGRQVPLQIFKTQNRGWGLRCMVDLQQGQFIDTYRGEIITNEEADEREDLAEGGKAQYLYTLDKHVGDNDLALEDCYVVDGEFMGGPTRFMNHSCEPNVRQYTVSRNKFDIKKYDIAFFAYVDIPAGTELTFDYLDKDDEDDVDGEPPVASQSSTSEKTEPMICKCGSKRCRGKLWI